MSRRNHDLIAVTTELETAGIDHAVRVGGRHMRITWQSPSGRARLCVIAVTPSSQISAVRARATVRRLLRADQHSG